MKHEPTKKSQSDNFVAAARELGCDDDPAHFGEVLKKVARHKAEAQQPVEPKPNSNGQKKSRET
jgi:hypothetical protein